MSEKSVHANANAYAEAYADTVTLADAHTDACLRKQNTDLLGSAASVSLALSVALARPAEAELSPLSADAEVAGFLFLEVLLVLG